MEETAKKLLAELEASEKTERNRIAIKRVKEILQIIDEPNRLRRFEEHKERCRDLAEKKRGKK